MIAGKESHDNAADYGHQIATPESMKRFPAELVPLPLIRVITMSAIGTKRTCGTRRFRG